MDAMKEGIISMLGDIWPDMQEWELYGPTYDTTGEPQRWEGDELLSSESFERELQRGYHFVNHSDHASPWSLGAWVKSTVPGHDGVLVQSQVEGLENGPRYSIIWSAGCSPCAIDHECIGEAFMNNPLGGAVAFVGNSRPELWYQDAMDEVFFRGIFEFHYPTLGEVFRNHQPVGGLSYAKNKQFLGDPELRFWTIAHPPRLQESCPSAIQLGVQDFQVAVTAEGTPVIGALVCVYKLAPDGQTEVFARGETGTGGLILFSIRAESPGEISVVATASNFRPAEGTCSVTAGLDPYVRFSTCPIIDDDMYGLSNGNGDHVVNPGERMELTVELQNTGGGLAAQVEADLTTTDPYVTLLQQHGAFGDIGPGASANGNPPYVFEVDSSRPRTNPDIKFDLSIHSGAVVWTDEFRLAMLADSLALGGSRLVEEPENTFTLDSLVITNYGWGAAAGVEATLEHVFPNDTLFVVDDDQSTIGEVAAGGTAVSYDSFVYRYVGSPPREVEPSFAVLMHDRYGRSWRRYIDMVPPPPPASISSRAVGDTFIELTWSKVDTPDLRGYNVYRSSSPGGPFQRVNGFIVDSNATYADQGLSPYTEYFYRATALDFSGNEGSPSPVVQVWTNPPYQTGWPAKTASGFQQRTSGVCGNVIGDDSLEVVAVMGCSIYVWTADGQRVPGWPKGLGVVPHSCPALADVNGDGYDEIFLGVSEGSTVYGWTGNGSNLPGAWPIELPAPITGSVAISDVNQDGTLEIVGVAGSLVYVWNPAGGVVSPWPLPLADVNARPCTIHGSPAIADLDPNALGLEMVFLAANAYGQPCLIVMGQDGSVRWRVELNGTSWASDLSSPVMGDLDGDGHLEVMAPVAGSDNLYVFTWDGQPLGLLSGGCFGSPALADLDENGNPDIVVVDGSLKAWSFQNGALLPLFTVTPPPGHSEYRAGPAVADINGDGHSEILTSFINTDNWNEQLQAYDRAGHPINDRGFPIYGVDEPMQEMSVADLDLDGDLELIAYTCAGGQVKVWDLPVPYDRRKVEWGSFHGDVRHTGLYAQPMQGNFTHSLNWWGRYRLLGDVTVTGYGLNVQPGTWVQAGPGIALTGITVNGGAFTAKGTRAAPTFFEPAPSVPNWTGVRVNNGPVWVNGCDFTNAFEGLAAAGCPTLNVGGSRFTNCQIGGITSLFSPAPSVKNCDFNGNGYYDICVRNAVAPSEIKGNRFTNSGHYGIWVESSVAPVIADNVLVNTQPMSQYGIKCFNIPSVVQTAGDLRHNTIAGYGQGGILCQASSPRIDGHNSIHQNTVFGLNCLDYSCPVVESSTVINHYTGVMGAGESYPDLGSVMMPVPSGYNSIYSNWGFNVVNANYLIAQPIMAQNNWWGQSPPDLTKFSGIVTYVPWLTAPPSDGAQGQPGATALPLELAQCRPNPFSSATRVMLANPMRQRLVVGIYDITGRLVQTLLDAVAPPGRSSLSWNGSDAQGRQVASGVYFCRLNAGQENKVSRIVYVRGK
jgi:hypothetical protein